MNKNLIGTGVALVTPFTENKNIDFSALEKLVNHVIDGGVDYLVILGTTGESVTLSKTEKSEVIEAICKYNNGRLPMVLGIGNNNTFSIVDEIKNTDLSRFEAILSVSPYYNKPSQEGIYRHFEQISKACPIDIIVYNVPGRTSSNIEPNTIARLAKDFDNIIAVKEASGVLSQSIEISKLTPKDFMIISGDDDSAIHTIYAGGHGCISVIAQGLPKEYSSMIRLALDNKNNDANQILHKIYDITKTIYFEGNPVGIKELLNILRICDNQVRLPLIKATDNLKNKLKLEYNKL